MLALEPRVANAVWQAVEGHLPPRPPDTHPLGCHRRRISDRDCFDGILIRLVTGCSWDVAARLCKASETTLRDRRTEWLVAGVFDKLVEQAIAGYDRIIGLDLSEVAVDGSLALAHQRLLQNRESRLIMLGPALGFFVTMAFLAATVYLITHGHAVAGTVLGTLDLVALVSVFVFGPNGPRGSG